MVALTSPMRVFDRRYVLLPVLAMVALITVTYFIAEERRAYVADLSKQILASQERIGQLGELIYACSDAESAQRGFLLTDEEQYLAPFDAAKADAYSMLDSLNATADPNNAVERSELAAIREYLDKKFLEMQVTIDIAKVNAEIAVRSPFSTQMSAWSGCVACAAWSPRSRCGNVGISTMT